MGWVHLSPGSAAFLAKVEEPDWQTDGWLAAPELSPRTNFFVSLSNHGDNKLHFWYRKIFLLRKRYLISRYCSEKVFSNFLTVNDEKKHFWPFSFLIRWWLGILCLLKENDHRHISLKVSNVKFNFDVSVRHYLLSTHTSKSNSTMGTYVENFTSKSNSTFGTFSDMCL